MIYLKLFYEFFKTGLFAIGGGLATLPFLNQMAVKTGWFTETDIANMIAISESTPGPIGVNMATYAGYTTAGILGSIVATLGLVLPSLIIIIIISKILTKFKDNRNIKNVFYGLRPASTALIAAAGYSVFTKAVITLEKFIDTGNFIDIINLKALILGIILFFAMKKFKLHPICFIVISAIAGIILKF